MATPLRFRYHPDSWSQGRVKSQLLDDLDRNIGARMSRPWFKLPGPYDSRRFDMDNGDSALFAWGDTGAYWLGNTETPKVLWQTNKIGFQDAPDAISKWAEREFLAELFEAEPWIKSYPALARFFLPVLSAKDGRESNRRFFRETAAGFPGTDRDAALSFYESLLSTRKLTHYRHTMAGKLGTSDSFDAHRMAAAMSEFSVAKMLVDQGCEIEPEAAVTSGHAIDFRVSRNGDGTLVEVTRPSSPAHRNASTAVQAINETVATKTADQLDQHGGGVTLFVDCSSFDDDAWSHVVSRRPDVGHRPAIIFRIRPGEAIHGYAKGGVPLGLDQTISSP